MEDEGIVAFAIQQSLRGLGYDVPVTVDSGEEALRVAAEITPDLVLMDIRLKGPMDGIEAARRISEAHGIPVIYLTAHSDAQTLDRAKVTVPYGYVLKPFDERALQIAVEMSLYRAAMQTALARTKAKLEAILACIGEGVVGTDPAGQVNFINPMAMALLGCTEAEAMNRPVGELFRLVDPASRSSVHLPVDKVAQERKGVSREDCVLLAKGGTSIAVEYNLAPLEGDGRSPGGTVLAFRDTTARRRIQRLVDSELEAAAALQRSLLPPPHARISGHQVEWLFHPSLFGSGDLFDVFPQGDDRLVFYMLDVVGHGISASAMSMLLHRFLSPGVQSDEMSALLRADPLSPGQVVRKLNTIFYRDEIQSFFSLLYGVVDTQTGEGTFVRAGHHYPLHQRTDGSTVALESDGAAVGMVPALEAEERSLSLAPGDRLYVFSDGVVECQNAMVEQFSVPRLRALVEETRSMSLEAAVREIDARVHAWRGEQDFDDDVSLLAIERT